MSDEEVEFLEAQIAFVPKQDEDGTSVGEVCRKTLISEVTFYEWRNKDAKREIDEVKLAVARLLGSMFLSNLRTKTFRGLKAAVLAGRLAGGRAYGYRKVVSEDEVGRPVHSVFEIDPAQAKVVRRIFSEFADGRSGIQIATGLNVDEVPSPRGGEWNASTIRAIRRSSSESCTTRSTWEG